ncbi:MAG: HAD hydrolase-like protein, partial [Christensenellaceae bacterium]|nr:HAD hydrolase-like protein [Christensenellaceae bacterium]
MALKYDLVIFDLDGTITDSGLGMLNSAKYALKTVGYPIPDDDVMLKMIGPPLSVSLSSILGVQEKDHKIVGKIYREHFVKTGYKDYSLYKGFRGLLEKLKHNGIKIALATSKPIIPTMKVMEYFRLSHFFDSINGIKDDNNEETKTTIIARALKLEHTNAVMVGDRKYDGDGAVANNIDFIGAAYGFGDEDELYNAGAKAIAKRVEELYSFLGLENLPSPEGKFISIEGMDGCGKTTQIELLYKNLNKFGFDFIATREPGGCKISEEIRNILLSNENIEM